MRSKDQTGKRTIGQAVADLRAANAPARNRAEKFNVAALRKALPPDSRWMWGDVGKPDCRVCLGLGFVRLDVPVGHPDFGWLFDCPCREAERK